MPLRFCEQLYVRSLQTAVAVPQDAAIGEGTVQTFDPDGGDGIGLGVGVGVGVGEGDGVVVIRESEKSSVVFAESAIVFVPVW